MSPDQNLIDITELKASLRRQQFITIATLTVTVVLAIAAMRHQPKTILEPPTRTKSMWVQGDLVSGDYMEEMGRHVAHMMLDVTPKVVESRHEEIKHWLHQKSYGVLEQRMTVAAKRLKESNATTFFWVTQVVPDPDHLRIALIGDLQTYVNGEQQRPDRTQSWLLELNSTGGHMTIKDWRETPLDDPLGAKPAPKEDSNAGAKHAQP